VLTCALFVVCTLWTVTAAAPAAAKGNTKLAVQLTTPGNGAVFTVGTTVSLSATASIGDGSIAAVAFYVRDTSLALDSSAPFTAFWTPSKPGKYRLTATVFDNNGASATAGVTVTVHDIASGAPVTAPGGAAPPPNSAPTVQLTTPVDGTTFTVGSAVSLAADASEPDGTITDVAFYAGSTLLTLDSAVPYTASWTPTVAGSYVLTAVARDNLGASATAIVPVNVIEVPLPRAAPTVRLTSPVSSGTVTAGTAVSLSADASEMGGSIADVAFYAGDTLLAVDPNAPYATSWTPALPGTYTLTATARDSLGATATTAVTVRVDAAPSSTLSGPISVAFTPSVDDGAVSYYYVEIFSAPASGDLHTATPVAVQDLGKPGTVNGSDMVDITSTLNTLPSGSYVAVISAVGPGGESLSDPSPALTW
jgi:hypothetical protein